MTIPVRGINENYDQETLLNDRSINWKGFEKADLLAQFKKMAESSPITPALLDPLRPWWPGYVHG